MLNVISLTGNGTLDVIRFVVGQVGVEEKCRLEFVLQTAYPTYHRLIGSIKAHLLYRCFCVWFAGHGRKVSAFLLPLRTIVHKTRSFRKHDEVYTGWILKYLYGTE